MAENWSDFKGWNLVLPPNRPTNRFLDFLRHVLSRQKRKATAAVLGSTPELRDVLFQLGYAQIFIFDFNPRFYEMMNSLRLTAIERETFVEGDWRRTLKPFKSSFDVILSDFTSGNLPYEDRQAFYHDVNSALKGSGQFVDRILINNFRLLSLNKLDKKYRGRPNNLQTYNDFSSEYIFCSELLRGRDTVESTLFYEILYRRFTNDSYLKGLCDGSHLITPPGAKWYYGRPWASFQQAYFSSFASTACVDDEKGTVFSSKSLIFRSRKR